jgi:hypothetical protein
VSVLVAAGHDVYSGDLIHGQNFLQYSYDALPGIMDDGWKKTECIVTNPPYSGTLKRDFTDKCFELNKGFALLMPVETIGAAGMQKMFKQHGIEIMYLDKRVNFGMPNGGWGGSAQFPVAWFCWHVLPEPVMYGKIDSTEWDRMHPKTKKIKYPEDFSI